MRVARCALGRPNILGGYIPVLVDGELGQASCYDTVWESPANLQAVTDAAAEVRRLGESAALEFGLDSSPIDPSAPWLEAVLTMEFVKTETRRAANEVFLIRQVPADFFTASAKAIRLLAAAATPKQSGATSEAEAAGKAPPDENQDDETDQVPIEYLMSWREILDELKQKNDEEKRNRIRRLNDMHDGPIIFPGKGAQPTVDKAKLVAWWNGLERRFRELEQQQADRQATVADQVNYGAAGIVVPGISGGVKKRREDRKP